MPLFCKYIAMGFTSYNAYAAESIKERISDEEIKRYVKTIRTAEKKIRNKAAYTIISIDGSFIKRKIGK